MQSYILRVESNIHMTRLSTLLETPHLVSEVVLFVENNITIAGLTDRKEHGPEMIMRNFMKLF